MSALYQDLPSVSNEDGWEGSGYQPTEADFEEYQECQLEMGIVAANIATKRRLKDLLDRTIADYERSLEASEPAPW